MYVDELFSKYAEWRVLYFFLQNPQAEVHVQGVARRLGVSPGTASTTLKQAHAADLVHKKVMGNVHAYSLNTENDVVQKLLEVVECL